MEGNRMTGTLTLSNPRPGPYLPLDPNYPLRHPACHQTTRSTKATDAAIFGVFFFVKRLLLQIFFWLLPRMMRWRRRYSKQQRRSGRRWRWRRPAQQTKMSASYRSLFLQAAFYFLPVCVCVSVLFRIFGLSSLVLFSYTLWSEGAGAGQVNRWDCRSVDIHYFSFTKILPTHTPSPPPPSTNWRKKRNCERNNWQKKWRRRQSSRQRLAPKYTEQ